MRFQYKKGRTDLHERSREAVGLNANSQDILLENALIKLVLVHFRSQLEKFAMKIRPSENILLVSTLNTCKTAKLNRKRNLERKKLTLAAIVR